LLHRREIDKLAGRVQEKGLTIVPRAYIKMNLIKCELAWPKERKFLTGGTPSGNAPWIGKRSRQSRLTVAGSVRAVRKLNSG